jgi:hypothetical protein
MVSANAARKPSLSATATNTAISAKGSRSSPKIAHFTNDIRIPYGTKVVGALPWIV